LAAFVYHGFDWIGLDGWYVVLLERRIDYGSMVEVKRKAAGRLCSGGSKEGRAKPPYVAKQGTQRRHSMNAPNKNTFIC
jgi:hypothetical protein